MRNTQLLPCRACRTLSNRHAEHSAIPCRACRTLSNTVQGMQNTQQYRAGHTQHSAIPCRACRTLTHSVQKTTNKHCTDPGTPWGKRRAGGAGGIPCPRRRACRPWSGSSGTRWWSPCSGCPAENRQARSSRPPDTRRCGAARRPVPDRSVKSTTVHWWWCRADILGANCDQWVNMVQCCFMSTETIRLIKTGRPSRHSHSSWALKSFAGRLFLFIEGSRLSVTWTTSANQNVTNDISVEKSPKSAVFLNYSNRTKGSGYRTKLSRSSNCVWYLIMMFKTNKTVCVQNQTTPFAFRQST